MSRTELRRSTHATAAGTSGGKGAGLVVVEHQGIAAGEIQVESSVSRVLSGPHHHAIEAKLVGARTAIQQVVPGATVKNISMGAADEKVIAALAVQETPDRTEETAEEEIVVIVPFDKVIGDHGHIGPAMVIGAKLELNAGCIGMRVKLQRHRLR